MSTYLLEGVRMPVLIGHRGSKTAGRKKIVSRIKSARGGCFENLILGGRGK